MQTPIDLIELQALLAENRLIALVWGIEDVQEVRPDLTDDQAWEVLQLVERRHDASIGVCWETLEWIASEKFGAAPDADEDEEEWP